MVLVWGIPGESPTRRLLDELEALCQPYVAVNQRHFADTDLSLSVDSLGNLDGLLTYQGKAYSLRSIKGVYLRLVDHTVLPEFQSLPSDHSHKAHVQRLIENLSLWTELSGCRVVNRLSAMASNSSRLFQAQVIRRHGFLTLPILLTNQPRQGRDVCKRFDDQVIYNSISGIPSIVQSWNSATDLEKLALLRNCTIPFQQRMEGIAVRVHVIGQQAIATRITAASSDYRYSIQQMGQYGVLSPFELKEDLAINCVALSQALGLNFSGIDLHIQPNGEVYCLEVNPRPAYTYYESNTNQPIAARLAKYISGQDS